MTGRKQERTALRGFMVRAKLVRATEEELEAEQAEITDEDYESDRQLAEELGFIPRTTPEATADQAAPPEE